MWTEERRQGVKYLVKTLWFEFDSDTVHSLTNRDDQTSMNNELREFGTTLVAVTTMPNQQLREMAELFD